MSQKNEGRPSGCTDKTVAYETIATNNALLIEVIKNQYGQTGGRYEFLINQNGKPEFSVIYEP